MSGGGSPKLRFMSRMHIHNVSPIKIDKDEIRWYLKRQLSTSGDDTVQVM